ncbi:Metallo-dependent phosphatase [Mycena kentingensis (nom. inval.)]|nr:Metallo-dependent phosphatase [Mycena kentingensis (nom. inval.)]
MIKSRHIVAGLRLVWAFVALWYERQVFIRSISRCAWPDSRLAKSQALMHVLLVADPQILDHRSYPDRPAVLTWISQFLVDLNLRKSWRAALRLRPDAVVFLGDMMDGGRFAMADSEYERYYARFASIFRSQIPTYYIPGNHDTGLGISEEFSPRAKERYISHFGPLNNHVKLANHSIILLDAPSLAEENVSQSVRGGTSQFIKSFADSHERDPVVLFTHIPLSRPEKSTCGPNRERGRIRQGFGFGYQNTLSKSTSSFVLDQLRPSVIFSGDDHDYCEHTHSFTIAGQTRQVREVTVKSLSMAMGIRRPGFQLLSLVPPDPNQTTSSHSDSLCLMPDQLGIYLSTYIPLLVLSLLAIIAVNALRVLNRNRSSRGVMRSRNSDEYAEMLPHPGSARKPPPPAYSRTFELFGRRRRIAISAQALRLLFPSEPPTSRGFVAGALHAVRDVAVFPLGVFALLATWVWIL